MSSNRVLAEKLKSAREVVGFLNKKTEENSMDEDMLSYVFNTLNDAVVEILFPPKTPVVLPGPGPAPIILHTQPLAVPVKDVTVENKGLVCVCGLYQSCAVCKKCEPRTPKPEADPKPKNKTTVWTAERRAEQSAKLKASWAAKKAQPTP